PDPEEEEAREEEAREAGRERPRWEEPDTPVLRAARAAVYAREADAVLVAWPAFAPAMERHAHGVLSVYFDSVRQDSQTARDRIERAVRTARKQIRADREAARGLPEGFSTPVELLLRNVAPDSRRVGHLLGAMMPMMLILMSLLGSFLPAIDLTAGEKERGTMQTLLCAPVLAIEIIAGKFLAVWAIALLTALANVVSLAFTVRRLLPDVVHVAPSVFALSFGLMVPVTFLFAALFLALAVFARDFKDGQNALMPAYLPLTLLAGVAALPVIQLDRWTAVAPVLNIAVLIKALFLGEAPIDLIFMALSSSALYAALALLLAARVFEREQVLLGGHERAADVLGLSRRRGGEPSAGSSMAALGAVLVVFFYGSLIVERLGLAAQLAATQLGLFLLPTLAIVLGFGFSPRATFALRPPPLRGLAGALLAGLSAWLVAGGLVTRLLPPPESVSKELGRLVLLEGRPLWVVLLLAAVLPAICEELLFRGLLFSGLRRVGPAAAIVASALLFGLAHGSVYRLLPTASLGLVMGYARWRTGSIASGMVIHALNNGIAVTLLYHDFEWIRAMNEDGMPWPAVAGGAAVLALGLSLLRTCRPAEPPPGAAAGGARAGSGA
ncbi:MAG: CPBP family intramembrane metalloprotease, partial [Polyangiaceae bacterium]|nr:CPBP family intramembrane metalloprotease [Polyangiaceae bacterium]